MAGAFDDDLHAERRQIVLAQDVRVARVAWQRCARRFDHAAFLTNTPVCFSNKHSCLRPVERDSASILASRRSVGQLHAAHLQRLAWHISLQAVVFFHANFVAQ